jgi:predicted HD superfamily hydrolase involved in NAD metabolism
METRPAGLVAHVRRTLETALPLAGAWGVDAGRVILAVWGHDLYRHLAAPQLLDLAASLDVRPGPVELIEPVFLHGPLGALALASEFGVDDEEVLRAVRCHPTAAPNMSRLEQAVFLADKTEPAKLDRPGTREVAELARNDPERAILRYLDAMLELAASEHWPVHDLSHAARNGLICASYGLR